MRRASVRNSARKLATCLALAPLLALSGCAAVQVRLGMKVYLAKTPVASIAATMPKGPGIAPGDKSPLVLTVTEPDGKTLQTEGAGHGKVLWKDLQVTTTVVTVNKKGVLTLPSDPRLSDGKIAHVTITAPSHPDLRADLDIPIRYDRNFAASFSGSSGFNGTDGIDGTDGMSGSDGSTDPDNPSPGGNGSNGGDGTDGTDGGDGGDGPPVQVLVALRAGLHPLLQVSVTAPGKQKLYLVDPQGGSLTVKSEGGLGGSGGRGGRGGRGGSGGSGSPDGMSGMDGSNGRDGSDGSPGRAGSITVTYDPQVKPYLAVFHLSNQGGPAPVLSEATVPPLW